jgi:hypothetical protein
VSNSLLALFIQTGINNNCRLANRAPMQWSDEAFAGFTRGNKTWLPVNENYHTVSVKVQYVSLLSFPLQFTNGPSWQRQHFTAVVSNPHVYFCSMSLVSNASVVFLSHKCSHFYCTLVPVCHPLVFVQPKTIFF